MIKILNCEETNETRTKVYPRIGGGYRAKSYGHAARKVTLSGIAYYTDRATVRYAMQRGTTAWYLAPWGGSYANQEWLLILTNGGTMKPMGAGWFEWKLDGIVVT